ncbi:uncharacterized protein LOC117556366 isoform X1 [Gymnodraco acuticeps]|uniref:Uncharacterized protein LOC117556366 isoform X1 n=1 Tax=Gymnodraco acuticeps TaxID=8218 RepID=A0A6P8VLT1_GYMAC|nr:uncharacterized protein LOC117556366 isoform X1 [Gymnodraco acuticeps]
MQVWDIPNVPKVSTPRMDNSLQDLSGTHNQRLIGKRSSLPRVRTTSTATTQLCMHLSLLIASLSQKTTWSKAQNT